MNENPFLCNKLAEITKQHLRQILLMAGISFLFFFLITFLMSPQYKSTTLVFPIRQFSVSKLIIEQNVGNQEDYMLLGDEDDAEKVLEIMNSDAMKTEIFNRFNLWERWKINKNSPKALFYMKNKWKNQVHIKKTVFNVIRIEVWDYTSAGAAELSNAIASFSDTLRKRMIFPVAQTALKIVENEYLHTLNEMNKMEDSLQKLRKLGILEYKLQVSALYKSYARAIEKNDQPAIQRLKSEIRILEQFGGIYHHLSENLRKYRFKFPVIKSKYEEARINATQILPSMFILQKGTADEYPDRPNRWLIGLAGTSGVVLFLYFYLLFKSRTHGK